MADITPTTDQEERDIQQENSSAKNDWDQAWPIDRIRTEAETWSLAGDSALLHVLKDFSQKMTSKTHDVEKEVDDVLHSTKKVGVMIHNVLNEFMMLANLQFVENRVYDDDLIQPSDKEIDNEDKKEKTKEEKEAELVTLIVDALKNGTDIIDNYFDKLDIRVVDSDSEGEEEETAGATDAILEAKDPYVSRPLPHLIGSPLFMQEDDVGLIEPLSDIEEEYHGPVSESEESKDSSEEYSESEDEDILKEAPSKNIDTKVNTSDIDSGDESEVDEEDLFDEKSKTSSDEEKEDQIDDTESAAANPFAAELAAKLAAKTQSKPEISENHVDETQGETESLPKPERKESKAKTGKRSRTSSSTSEKKSHPTHSIISEVAADKDVGLFMQNEEDEIDPIFGVAGGLFSTTSTGLFGSSPPKSGGLFDDNSVTETSKSIEGTFKPDNKKRVEQPQQGRSSSNLSSDGDLFPENSPKKDTTITNKTSATLFDISDEESDLFNVTPKINKESRRVSESAGDDPQPGDTTAPIDIKKKKLPAGAVPMFAGSSDQLTAAFKRQISISSAEPTDESLDKKVANTKTEENTTKKTPKEDMTSSASSNSLFASEPHDDPANSKTKKILGSSLFDNTGDDDDLFSTTKIPEESKKQKKESSKVSTLFQEDEDEDELFSGLMTKATPSKKVPSATAIAAEDILSSSPIKSLLKDQAKVQVPTQPAKRQISLFDNLDEDNEDDDLFGMTKPDPKPKQLPSNAPAKISEKPQPVKSKNLSSSLFEDEGDLFNDADSVIDLFGISPQKKSDSIVSRETKLSFSESFDNPGDLTQHVKSFGNPGGHTSPAKLFDNPGDHASPAKLFDNPGKHTSLAKSITNPGKPTSPAKSINNPGEHSPSAKSIDNPSEHTLPAKSINNPGEHTPPAKSINNPGEHTSPYNESDPKSSNTEDSKKQNYAVASDKSRDVLSVTSDPGDASPVKQTDAVDSGHLFPVLPKVTERNVGAPRTETIDQSNKPSVSEKPKVKPPKLLPKPRTSSRLSESSEDDMFKTDSMKKDKVLRIPEPLTASLPGSTENMSPEIKKTSPSIKIPPGAVPIFGMANPRFPFKPDKNIASGRKTDSDQLDPKNILPSTSVDLFPSLSRSVSSSSDHLEKSLTFDDPPLVQTLSSANKTRAKVQHKRRPPSKGVRASVAANSEEALNSDEFWNLSKPISPLLPTQIDERYTFTQSLPTNFQLPPPRTYYKPSNLANRGLNDEIPENISVSQNAQGDSGKPDLETDDRYKLGNDLFSTSDIRDSKSSELFDKHIHKQNIVEKDFVTSLNNEIGDFFSEKSKTKLKKNLLASEKAKENDGSIFDENNITSPDVIDSSTGKTNLFKRSDIFGESVATEKVPVSRKLPEQDDIFASDILKQQSKDTNNKIDDLFSDVKVPKISTNHPVDVNKDVKSSTLKSEDVIPFATSDISSSTKTSNNDIFSNIPKTKENYQDDLDDIFADASVNTKATPKKKTRITTKEESIFDDDTDIFADIPVSTKPKDKKKKIKTTVVQKQSIFKDNIDDIFADVLVKKSENKQTTKKKSSTATSGSSAVKTAKVDFDDPLNIFGS